ncbi:ATP-binding protein [Falsiroseomonas sp. HC035]|uniref:ATP-binding protein n=1 Tax=Falsiroseomonas sp. HC035 TaxID=3390999 RepID=UPI003D31562E
MLEETRTPVIWTANSLEGFGAAVLRRMTCCVEVRVPPPAERARLWREAAVAEGVAAAPETFARLAGWLPASPGVARTAMRAARLAGGAAETVEWAVTGMARAMAGGRLPLPQTVLEGYEPALVNADRDLGTLAERLALPGATRAVSLLLSGPPGSGKSAYARYLADRMGLPVLQKRASDLLSMWVGGTEALIAAAFAEARDSSAFLVFDEADSLLGDRQHAAHGWEVSEVNEMLTWMESHPLPFCCTTNLVERLDPAAMRRFLVKARFGYLTATQAALAFRRCFAAEPPEEIALLETLTPSDFTIVQRQASLEGYEGDASWLLMRLRAEQDAKPGLRQVRIGFSR